MEAKNPSRLVKVIVPADLVRRMDHAILGSGGAYQDRSEFVTEAIRDRLTEEAAATGGKSEPTADSISTNEPDDMEQAPPGIDGSEDALRLGAWSPAGTYTVAARSGDEVSFGLHNRDLPTLWALDRLASMCANGPVRWDEYIIRIRAESALTGEQLRLQDLARANRIKAGLGFPKPGPRVDQSIDRFVAAMVGSLKRRDGPLFGLGLVGSPEHERHQLAPTIAGLETLRALIDDGLGSTLPHPALALERWWGYLGNWAPSEHAAWTKVLTVVREEPTREELVARFPEWPRTTADTNTTGFISRSREWGLVEPELQERRYQLTELGMVAADGRTH